MRILGRLNFTVIMHFKYCSKDIPCFSYMANRNHGSITITIRNAAALVGILFLSKKKSGKPTAAAPPKHIVCLLVSPNKNFERTTVKSLGIDT